MDLLPAKFRKCRSRWGSLAVVGLLCVQLVGCGGGETDSAPVVQPVGTVTGQVISLANTAPVSGATVKTEAGSTTTATNGTFTVSAPVGDRTLVNVEATGFAEAFPVARVTAGQTTTLGVKLVPIGVTETVSVAAGGTVSVPNSPARVVIPSNSLVPAAGGTPAGSVNVSVTAINPAEEPSVMPGGFNGISAAGGSAQPLESGGAMQLDIRDGAGTRYTLAQGSTATIRIPLGTQSANPPATMPLWYFDEEEGVWREEGEATLQGTGSNRFYEGTVARVVYWNADLVLESIEVKGCVKDANGQPVGNALVQTEGIDYTGVAQDVTAADGTFQVVMRRNSRAKLGLFEFDRQTFNVVPVSNTVNVGPSATDVNRPNCLVKQPGQLAITVTALPGGTVGLAYNQTLVASGGIPGYVWSLNAGSNPLPAGISLNPSGVLSGTPTEAAATTITVTVTDSAGGTTTKDFTLTIVAPNTQPLSITTSVLPGGTVGTAYNTSLAATGGTGVKTWSIVAGSLPSGLTLDGSTGVISGTPTAPGTSTCTIRVQDSAVPPLSNQKSFSLTIGLPSGEGGGGTLTVSNAPASVGSTFVVNPQLTSTRAFGTGGRIVLVEGATNQEHVEAITVAFGLLTGGIEVLGFGSSDSLTDPSFAWLCGTGGTSTPRCSGITLDRSAGTLTFVNAVLTEDEGKAPPITLNGTVTFPPF